MKKFLCIGMFIVVALLTACSAGNNDAKFDSSVKEDSAGSESYFGFESDGEIAIDQDTAQSEDESMSQTGRKIIHRAYLSVNVSDFENSQQYIESKVEQLKGYVVETNIYSEDDYSYGNIIVRIPAQDFRKFITDVEENSNRILDRSITGDDVTEQYVDLESRLKSKRVVEERLINFLEEAEKTEDLLKISADLSVVQEEIEVLVGKINYLTNQVDYSTVEIHLYEDRIVMPNIDGKDLNTWEKTKQQFLKSIQYLLSFGSALIVFFIGNIPIIVLIALGGIAFYYFVNAQVKKRPKRDKNDLTDDHEGE